MRTAIGVCTTNRTKVASSRHLPCPSVPTFPPQWTCVWRGRGAGSERLQSTGDVFALLRDGPSCLAGGVCCPKLRLALRDAASSDAKGVSLGEPAGVLLVSGRARLSPMLSSFSNSSPQWTCDWRVEREVSERTQSEGSASNGLSGLFCASRWCLLSAAPFARGAERSELRHQSPLGTSPLPKLWSQARRDPPRRPTYSPHFSLSGCVSGGLGRKALAA